MHDSISSGREANPTSLIVFECFSATREIVRSSDKTSVFKVRRSDLRCAREDCIEETLAGGKSDRESPNLYNV